MSGTSATEKRSSNRRPLDTFQQLRDTASGELIGYLGDISLVGLRLLSHDAPALDGERSLRLNYVCRGGERVSCVALVERVWSRPPQASPYHETGLRFIALPRATRLCVERVMTDLAERATAEA